MDYDGCRRRCQNNRKEPETCHSRGFVARECRVFKIKLQIRSVDDSSFVNNVGIFCVAISGVGSSGTVDEPSRVGSSGAKAPRASSLSHQKGSTLEFLPLVFIAL